MFNDQQRGLFTPYPRHQNFLAVSVIIATVGFGGEVLKNWGG